MRKTIASLAAASKPTERITRFAAGRMGKNFLKAAKKKIRNTRTPKTSSEILPP